MCYSLSQGRYSKFHYCRWIAEGKVGCFGEEGLYAQNICDSHPHCNRRVSEVWLLIWPLIVVLCLTLGYSILSPLSVLMFLLGHRDHNTYINGVATWDPTARCLYLLAYLINVQSEKFDQGNDIPGPMLKFWQMPSYLIFINNPRKQIILSNNKDEEIEALDVSVSQGHPASKCRP